MPTSNWKTPVIDPALVDVPCPMCGAPVLELCTRGDGAEMEATAHAPRRVRAGVGAPVAEPIAPLPTPAQHPDTCYSGRHPWTPDNVYTAPNGRQQCIPCRRIRQSGENAHSYGGTHCRNGHEYTPENTYTPPGGEYRACLTCKRSHRKKAKK